MKQYGLIGKHLAHSFSKNYFNSKFEREGISHSNYELYELNSSSELPGLVRNTNNLCGLNVTIPFKEEVISYLDEIDPMAKKIGAVNTIKINQDTGHLKGFNTDYHGFKASIKPFLAVHHERALILGSGGASKAVQQVLADLNIDFLMVTRNPKGDSEIGYQDINHYVIQHHKFIINTTPLGMYPKVDAKPTLPYELLDNSYFLCDLIYNPEETLFLKEGKQKGCITLNGLSMLKLQAEKAWEIWNN